MDTTITLYAHQTCSKSATAASLLGDRGIDFELRDYVARPLTADELRSLIASLPDGPLGIVRSWDDRDQADITVEAVVEHLSAHPDDMQRPIISSGDRSAIARPPQLALDFVGIAR